MLALRTTVNVEDRVGLIGDILNYDVSELDNMYYDWYEVGGQLNDSMLALYRENVASNSLNLILQQNVLRAGETYSFQVTASQYEYALDEDTDRRRMEENRYVDGLTHFEVVTWCHALGVS